MGAILRRDWPDSAQSSPGGLAGLCQDLVAGVGGVGHWGQNSTGLVTFNDLPVLLFPCVKWDL